MNAPLRIGQIGVGGMGRAHAAAVLADPRADLVGVCDTSEAALQAIAGPHGVPAFQRADDLLANVPMDALIVVLPHDLYPPVIEAAARRGIAILKEKPFARDLTDAMLMANSVETHGVPFLCAGQRVYQPAFRRAKELVEAGAVGDVFMVQGRIQYCWRLDPETWSWRGDRSRSGGIAVLDSGWHLFDAVSWLVGLPSSMYCRIGGKQAVPGRYEVDDKAVMCLDFPDGAVGTLTTCFLTTPSVFELILHGTAATLRVDGGRVELHPRQGEPVIEECPAGDPIAAQLAHFIDVVTSGATPRVGASQAVRLQRICEAAYESASTDRRVELLG